MRPSAWLCVVVAACGSPAVQRAADRPPPIPKLAPLPPPSAFTSGSRIAATADGAFAADEDSGTLVALDGRALAIGRGLGQLVYDPTAERVYVADRRGDRVVVVDAETFAIVASYATPAEPFGVALTPDRTTLLATTLADRALVAFDTKTGALKWRTKIAAGTRGIAVSPDGERALLSSVATGELQLVELTGAHRVAEVPYSLECESCGAGGAMPRGTGAVRFLDATHVVATFQRSIPEALIDLRTDRYGGGMNPPITQHVAFFTFSATSANESVAQLADNQPRSLAWDPARKTLYIAGHGSDTMIELPKLDVAAPDTIEAHASSAVLRTDGRCGPDGMTIAGDGSVYVWCAFTRSVLRMSATDDLGTAELSQSAQLMTSAFTSEQQRGHILFDGTTAMVNRDRALACNTCHVDGHADGLSWRIGKQSLQTPILAGRIAEQTAPYRWDGSAPTLADSLASTVHRLAGSGLSTADTAAMIAYLRSLPRPRTPTVNDPAAVARGKALFANEAGCASCHSGGSFADGELHEFESSLSSADTPSLVGLAASAPYYHDGSASTLHELLHGAGTVHGMSAELSKLGETQLADLQAYLETL
ncbi:MAG TPA: c-type cytochrome [Kofleriaceae bacterium]|nr:c-type cytochrome [Kofleriaceae bacterium]